MIFTSAPFFVFLIVVITLYYILPKKIQWIWLLLASCFFYLQSSPVFMAFLAASILITYGAALAIGKINEKRDALSDDLKGNDPAAIEKRFGRQRAAVCAAGLVLNIGILAYTKYINFLGENITNLVGGKFTAIDVIIPLGISFYTFQSAGYLADVCRGTVKPEKNPLKFALFISFFPQILQGPIAKYGELAPQLTSPHFFSYDKVKSGMLRVLWGLFKKLVIADRAAFFVNMVFDNWKDYHGFIVAIAAIMYMLQLYADFSGYMDIAIGAGEMLDITMTENFRTPFFSTNIAEFWRRWHISLGRWFKDNIYIPMGGNRKGMPMTVLNLAVVWLVTGIWHGSSWNFVFWGMYFGALIILSKLSAPITAKVTEKLGIRTDTFSFKLFRIVKTALLVIFGFLFFRADSLSIGFSMTENMFNEFNPWVFTDGTLLKLGLDGKNWNVLILSAVILFCVSLANEKGIKVREKLMQQNTLFQWIVYIAGLFAVLIYGVYGPAFDASAFIYLNF